MVAIEEVVMTEADLEAETETEEMVAVIEEVEITVVAETEETTAVAVDMVVAEDRRYLHPKGEKVTFNREFKI